MFEDFRLDAESLMLYKQGKTVALKPKVVETLVALVERRGEVIGKGELMHRLWGESFVEESNLTQNIYLLRKCLGSCADGQPFIENFPRRGYRFNGRLDAAVAVELVLATHTETKTVVEEHVRTGPTRWSWLLLGPLLVILLAGIGMSIRQFIPRGSSDVGGASTGASFQTFTLKRHSDSNVITAGLISHDGKFIAYTDDKNAIWLKNTVTGDAINILRESDTVARSVISFSPDDNQIYFFNIGEDKKSKFARISVVGGSVERLMIEGSASDASLSPDGKHLSFIRHNNGTANQSLILANTDGTGERQVAVSQTGEWFGTWSQSTAWSPDGGRIAVAGGTRTGTRATPDIKILNLDGVETSTITGDANWLGIDAVLWLPNGDDLLAIGRDGTSQGQIYKHTISAGQWRRLTNDLSNYVGLSVTADGKTVVTIQHENPGNLWILPATGDKAEAKQITAGRNIMTDATGVSWTPDGKVVYATNAGDGWDIRLIDRDGANQKQLTQNCAGNDTCSQPVASADGRYIVFQANRGGVRDIWRMEPDGSNPTRLTDEGGFAPSFSPDGRSVVFTRFSPAETFWQVPIEGGKAEQFSDINLVGNISFAPDGRKMVFGYYDETADQPFQTCVAAVSASAPEKCFDISRSFARWTPDSKAYYYLDHSYRGIWKQPLDGERSMFLEFPGERTNGFAFSPDGKYLVVGRSKPTQDIVALTDAR